MVASLNAVFYCKEPPDISFEDGHFHVRYRVGGMDAEFVLSPNTYLRAIRAANRAADAFHEGRSTVATIPRKKPRAAH